MKLTTESTVVNDKKLYTDIENAQTSADNAQDTADQAKVIADNTNQYFWFTSTGADTGAHISEIKQSDFLASPRGGNLLARSNGIALREGLTELAIFSADELRIGRTNANRAMINSGSMDLYNSSNQRFFTVSADGMTYGTHTVANTGDVSTAENNAKKEATNYINTDSTGIKVHSTNDSNNYVHIGSSGMEVYKGGDSVAKFGATARIGEDESSRFLVNSASIQAFNASNEKYFEVTANGITYGTKTVADTGYVDNAESVAERSATDYISTIGSSGIRVHPSGATTNFVNIDGYGMQVYNNGVEIATFGATARIGNDSSNHTIVDTNGFTVNVSGATVANFGATATIGNVNSNHAIVDTNGFTVNSAGLSLGGLYNTNLGSGLVGGRLEVYYGSSATTRLGSAYLSALGVYGSAGFECSIDHIRTLGSFSKYGAPTAHTTSYSAVWFSNSDGYCYISRPTSSSRRYKKDIVKVQDSKLDPHRLYDVPVVQFKYKDGYLSEDDPYNETKHNVIGFIAEDIDKHYPIATIKVEDKVENWDERYIIPPMLALIQEQHEEIESIKARFAKMERSN